MSACGFPGCTHATRRAYPGGDPENGPARAYCAAGHAQCYQCGNWFAAVDENAESYECEACEAHNATLPCPACAGHGYCNQECPGCGAEPNPAPPLPRS